MEELYLTEGKMFSQFNEKNRIAVSGFLHPCPFCGNTEPYFVRIGDSKQSPIIACGYCGCRMEANETDIHNGSAWNRRACIEDSESILEE